DRLVSSWGLSVALLYTLATASVIITALADPPEEPRPKIVPFLVSYAAVAVLLVLYPFALGSTWHGLLGGLVVMPLQLAGAFGDPRPIYPESVLAAALSFGLAASRPWWGRVRGPTALASEGLLLALKFAFFVIVALSLRGEFFPKMKEDHFSRARLL